MNEETKAKIRKYKKNLVITGNGFMAIMVWSLVKFAIRIIEEGGFGELIGEGNSTFYEIMFYAALLAFFVGTSLLHLYIGISAKRYGNDRSRHWGFLVAAGLYAGFTVFEFPSLIDECLKAFLSDDPFSAGDTSVAAILMELTILFILFDMISSALLLRKEENKLS